MGVAFAGKGWRIETQLNQVLLSPNFSNLPAEALKRFHGKAQPWKGLKTVWLDRHELASIQVWKPEDKNPELYRRAIRALQRTPWDKRPIEYSAKIENVITHKGRLWAKVKLQVGACDGGPAILNQGWVPVHNDQGELNLWYSSRGC